MKLRTSGYFYRLDAPLDAGLARGVFERIEAKRFVTAVQGAPYFKGTPRTRERVALCIFEVRRPPAFAPTAEELIETRYGFCCLIEADSVLFVAHSGFAWSDALLPFEDPQTLTHDDTRAVLGSIKVPRVDKVATRSMSVGAKSIYARTLEGDDLESSLPSLGASRHVVRAIRTVEATTGATLHIVPGSSRLTQLGLDAGAALFATFALQRLINSSLFAVRNSCSMTRSPVLVSSGAHPGQRCSEMSTTR